MLDRKLIDYLPPVLQSVMEFAAITGAQQPEIEAAWDALNLVMDNQFIDTATEAGVMVWEKELNIVPLATDTLEDRKQRLKTAWTYGVVYTYNWLVNWLKTSCGENNPLPTINEYTLRVSLPVSVDYLHILDDMRRYVAANVLIDPLILLSKIKVPHYTGSAFRHSIKQTLTTEAWDMDGINLLTDENSKVLMEEAENKVFYEEVNTNGT
jgi:hypothetical protein